LKLHRKPRKRQKLQQLRRQQRRLQLKQKPLLRKLPQPKRLKKQQLQRPKHKLKLLEKPRLWHREKLKLNFVKRPKSSGQAQEESLLTNW
jgi:hypothetical protein